MENTPNYNFDLGFISQIKSTYCLNYSYPESNFMSDLPIKDMIFSQIQLNGIKSVLSEIFKKSKLCHNHVNNIESLLSRFSKYLNFLVYIDKTPLLNNLVYKLKSMDYYKRLKEIENIEIPKIKKLIKSKCIFKTYLAILENIKAFIQELITARRNNKFEIYDAVFTINMRFHVMFMIIYFYFKSIFIFDYESISNLLTDQYEIFFLYFCLRYSEGPFYMHINFIIDDYQKIVKKFNMLNLFSLRKQKGYSYKYELSFRIKENKEDDIKSILYIISNHYYAKEIKDGNFLVLFHVLINNEENCGMYILKIFDLFDKFFNNKNVYFTIGQTSAVQNLFLFQNQEQEEDLIIKTLYSIYLQLLIKSERNNNFEIILYPLCKFRLKIKKNRYNYSVIINNKGSLLKFHTEFFLFISDIFKLEKRILIKVVFISNEDLTYHNMLKEVLLPVKIDKINLDFKIIFNPHVNLIGNINSNKMNNAYYSINSDIKYYYKNLNQMGIGEIEDYDSSDFYEDNQYGLISKNLKNKFPNKKLSLSFNKELIKNLRFDRIFLLEYTCLEDIVYYVDKDESNYIVFFEEHSEFSIFEDFSLSKNYFLYAINNQEFLQTFYSNFEFEKVKSNFIFKFSENFFNEINCEFIKSLKYLNISMKNYILLNCEKGDFFILIENQNDVLILNFVLKSFREKIFKQTLILDNLEKLKILFQNYYDKYEIKKIIKKIQTNFNATQIKFQFYVNKIIIEQSYSEFAKIIIEQPNIWGKYFSVKVENTDDFSLFIPFYQCLNIDFTEKKLDLSVKENQINNYLFPKLLLHNLDIFNLKLFVVEENLWVFQKYKFIPKSFYDHYKISFNFILNDLYLIETILNFFNSPYVDISFSFEINDETNHINRNFVCNNNIITLNDRFNFKNFKWHLHDALHSSDNCALLIYINILALSEKYAVDTQINSEINCDNCKIFLQTEVGKINSKNNIRIIYKEEILFAIRKYPLSLLMKKPIMVNIFKYLGQTTCMSLIELK